MEWETLNRGKAQGPNQKSCNVCCKEALKIMRKDSLATNKREELRATCLYRQRHLIKNIRDPAKPQAPVEDYITTPKNWQFYQVHYNIHLQINENNSCLDDSAHNQTGF